MLEVLFRNEPWFSSVLRFGRFLSSPSLSLPLTVSGWSFRPEISLRDTSYTQHLLPTRGIGGARSSAINRKAFEASVEILPPSVDRVFDRELLGRKWKHVIEPRINYRYVTGINNFAEILRFDERDILSDTNEVEYALVNRLYAKRSSGEREDCGPEGMPSLTVGRPGARNPIPWERGVPVGENPCQKIQRVREIVSWELAQKYFIDPTFGGALRLGAGTVFTSTADFTGIAFLTDSSLRRFSPLISRLRVQPTMRTEATWAVDYDVKSGRVNSSTAFLNYRFVLFTFIVVDAYLRAPCEALSATRKLQGPR